MGGFETRPYTVMHTTLLTVIALGELGPALPIGLTLAGIAVVMRALGCRRAVALGGGISAQLMVREGDRTRTWRGWRAVPFGLIAEPRSP